MTRDLLSELTEAKVALGRALNVLVNVAMGENDANDVIRWLEQNYPERTMETIIEKRKRWPSNPEEV